MSNDMYYEKATFTCSSCIHEDEEPCTMTASNVEHLPEFCPFEENFKCKWELESTGDENDE